MQVMPSATNQASTRICKVSDGARAFNHVLSEMGGGVARPSTMRTAGGTAGMICCSLTRPGGHAVRHQIYLRKSS